MPSVCYICDSDRFVDGHHYDCEEGKLSPEVVPLCRRCHRTYHDLGVDYFEDDYLDKVIEIENKRREIRNANLVKFNEERLTEAIKSPWNSMLRKPLIPLSPLKREDIRRSTYWNKTHGKRHPQKPSRETKDERQLGFEMIDNLLSGE